MKRPASKQRKSVPAMKRRLPRRRPSAKPRANDTALAVFAHDIRTALTGILALGELLASSNLGERERHWATGVKTSAEHLAALTTLVIDAAKSARGRLALQEEPFRLQPLIDALAASLAARADTKGLRSEVSVTGDRPELLVGDVVRLRAALENLIDNAVKFTAKGVIRLQVHGTVRTGRARLEFTVADSGIGLKAGEIERLFRPFSQANREIARRYGGAGLGLSVVKLLAQRMGGDLAVTSAPGRGARFCFSAVLPVATAAAAGVPPARAARPPARALHILCAEDNPYGRVILNTILTELGHRADFVGSGEEAVAAVTKSYDVVLMDVTLAGIDGLEATRRIRALAGSAAAVPIIGVSGRTGRRDEDAARAAGMNAFLHKPLSPSALQAALVSNFNSQI